MPSKRKLAQQAKKRRPKKKIVLLLLEGRSDFEALVGPLANILYEKDPAIEVEYRYLGDRVSRDSGSDEHGDITSQYGVTPKYIKKLIDEHYLVPFFNMNSFYTKDIALVAHVIDTDGAFIPDERVLPAPEGGTRLEYRPDCILASDVDGIIDRNRRKADNLRYLASITSIRTEYDRQKREIPYRAFFISSNLDHFLHGDANMDDSKKVQRAKEFADKCAFQPSHFFDIIQGDKDFADCGYDESWLRIQEGCTSLEPHSNIGLLVDDLME